VSGKALDTALAYFAAWTSGDVEAALAYVAPDVVCDAPTGRILGAAAYRDFLGPFVGILKRTDLIAAFGDDEQAVVVYDTETLPVASAPGAEAVRVVDGRIVYSRFVFDRAPFLAARERAAA